MSSPLSVTLVGLVLPGVFVLLSTTIEDRIAADEWAEDAHRAAEKKEAAAKAAYIATLPPPPPDPVQLQRIAQGVAPHSDVLRHWPLVGGISAQMTALDVALPDNTTTGLVVRQPSTATLARDPEAATREFRTLQMLATTNIPAPRAYALDQSDMILPAPYLVIERLAGQPEYAPVDVTAYAAAVAAQLAAIHSIPNAASDFGFLSLQATRLATLLDAPQRELDESLNEGRIRAALAPAWPLPQRNQLSLLHGDFWPGNLLWCNGAIVGVVDWEDAEVGEPCADVAITRLDMLLVFGAEAMQAFTATYRALATIDLSDLAHWDLYAALRPAGQIAEWSAVWPALGRSDITEATMQAAHALFVQQALATAGR